jgi:dihydrofolate reductase
MRKIIVHEFISLDGVIQAPGGPDEDTDGGFVHGGWTLPYWHDDIGKHFLEVMAQSDTLLLGRKTWQTHAGAFEPMNAVRKVVVSTTLKSAADWRNSTLISGNVVAEVRNLKGQTGKNILIDGSSVLIHTLAENDLIDEYSLHVHPLVLGSGKRLFPDRKCLNLNLIESQALPTGVLLQRYQLAK